MIDILIYNISLIPVIFFSLVLYLMTLSNLKIKCPRIRGIRGKLPFITIQLPVYNDPVIGRCIEACLKLDYPKNKMEIIVADDSTDKKTREIVNTYNGRVKIIRRRHRKGFKAGALNNALKYSKGDIVVVFDSDWVPPKNFLKRIVKIFNVDKKIAAVQGRIKVLNPDVNLVTRFASALLITYHRIWMPVQNHFKVAYLCGTAMAIRKDALLKVGGWNEKSLTEDADLTIKFYKNGYKIIYLEDLKVGGEVPYTFWSFIKQQMRWAYGQTRTFLDHWKDILFSKVFNFKQKFIIFLTSFGHFVTPFVVLMAISGQLGWVIGTPKPFSIMDFIKFVAIFVATSGFLISAGYAMKKENYLYAWKEVSFAALTLGIALAFFNTIAFLRALFNRPMIWFRTPKWGSLKILNILSRLFTRKKNA